MPSPPPTDRPIAQPADRPDEGPPDHSPNEGPPDLTEQLRRHMADLRAVLRADIGHESHLLQAELARHRGELSHELAVVAARCRRRLARCERRLTLRLALGLLATSTVIVAVVASGVVVR
ncbi:MAG: hypothetical protein ACFCVK_26160 [Acidimicrobiales bacterium]